MHVPACMEVSAGQHGTCTHRHGSGRIDGNVKLARTPVARHHKSTRFLHRSQGASASSSGPGPAAGPLPHAPGGLESLPQHLRDLKLTGGDRRDAKEPVRRSFNTRLQQQRPARENRTTWPVATEWRGPSRRSG